jgi:hypothetical protein
VGLGVLWERGFGRVRSGFCRFGSGAGVDRERRALTMGRERPGQVGSVVPQSGAWFWDALVRSAVRGSGPGGGGRFDNTSVNIR